MNNLRILVVDDDPVTRTLLKKRLAKEAYEVITANDGVAAVDCIANEYYDVILTDLMMPGGVDGIAVLEMAKKKNVKTEVILITAHASLDNAIEAMKKGAADYLQKPINLDELIMRLQKIGNLKMLLKNACDLRDAMDATEQASAQTIQTLELAVAELEDRLVEIKSILAQNDIPLKERVDLAMGKC